MYDREASAQAAEFFCRALWTCMPSEVDLSWVDRFAEVPLGDQPAGDTGELVREMLDADVRRETIARFARIIAYHMAFDACYLLEGDLDAYSGLGAPDDLTWRLFTVTDDEERRPITVVNGPHEFLLDLDPEGDELRPPKRQT